MDSNINYNILHEVIQNANHKHLPSNIVKYNKYKHKRSNWITHGIIKSIHFRDNLYKDEKMAEPNLEQFVIQKINLKTYNNILKTCIRVTKKNYYESLFRKFKDDIRRTWKTINDILNKTKRKKSISQFFRDVTNIITNKIMLTIANKFNSFLAKIGTALSQKIITPKNKSVNLYLTKKT